MNAANATETSNSNNVSFAILNQLGDQAVYMMTGLTVPKAAMSGHLKYITNGLRIKPRGTRKCNAVDIVLAADDTYTIRTARVSYSRKTHDTTDKTVSVDDGVYVDSMREVIESRTGLYLSIGTMGR
jgi:hypothetical protein